MKDTYKQRKRFEKRLSSDRRFSYAFFRKEEFYIGLFSDLKKLSFSNVEQQSLKIVKYTLAPLVCHWEQAMNRSLLNEVKKRNYFVKYLINGNMTKLKILDYLPMEIPAERRSANESVYKQI